MARTGIERTTIEDVARQAGVARATVYRWFPGGRDEVIDATISRRTDEFFLALAAEVEGCAELDEVVGTALRVARRWIDGDGVLQQLLATEADRVLPAIVGETRRLEPRIARFLEPWLAHGEADYVARMFLSVVGAPGSWSHDEVVAALTVRRNSS